VSQCAELLEASQAVRAAANGLGWAQWQRGVLQLLRAELREVLDVITIDDVGWESWRELYDQGRTPRAAVNRALERDF
jgi:hypothetical protein